MVAFTPFPAPTGASTRLAQRIVAFGRAGWAVDVLTPKSDTLPHVSRYAGARILRVPMPQHRELVPGVTRPTASSTDAPASQTQRAAAFERAVRRQLQGTDYDAVYLFDAFVGPEVSSSVEGTPVVYEPTHEPGSTVAPELLAEEHVQDQDVLGWCAAIIVPTHDAAKRYITAGARLEKVHVVRHCADLELFGPPPDGRRWRSQPVRIAVAASELQPDELRLITDSLLLLPKSVKVRMTVSAAVMPDMRTSELTASVLGDRLGLRDPVLYDDLPPFYQEADLGLVVSTDPTESGRLQTLAEMMATGLATIVPDVPSMREIARHDREALLVPPGNPEALMQAIKSLATDQARADRMGLAARARAEELLSEHVASRKVVEIVGALLTPPRLGVTQAQDDVADWTPITGPRLRTAASTASTVPGRSSTSAATDETGTFTDQQEEITSPEIALERARAAETAVETNPGRK